MIAGIPWQKLGRARPRHIVVAARRALATPVEAYFATRAKRRVRRAFPDSSFVGPYERDRQYNGIWEEQWLWAHRKLIRGTVLDMSTPRYHHEYIYHLPDVKKVMISDLSESQITKGIHSSKVDIIGDFCAIPPPVPAESFETVLCLSILEHCADPFAMVQNIGLILRPGGVAFFLCPFAYVDGHLHPDYWRFGRDGYLLLARKAGLDVIETGEFDDLGGYFILKFGWSASATEGNRGVPVVSWMICRRPG